MSVSRTTRDLGIAVFLVTLMGCLPSPTSLIEVSDPDGVALSVSELSFEIKTLNGDLVAEESRKMTRSFPVTVTLAASADAVYEVTATAINNAGRAIARGRVFAELSTATTPATLRLGSACDTDCDDGFFCNGEETCDRGVCIRGPAPCQANFECVRTECVEESNTCSTSVDQSVCEQGDGVSRYCSPSSGCIAGAPCTEDDECQDGSVCNGEEQCVNFTCAAGTPPNPDDGSPCTVDGCNDANGLGPLFNIQDPTKDGNACDLPNGSRAGICLSTSADICVESRCGDGFLDPFREPCDDGNENNTDACIKNEAAPGQFVCVEARCGDGYVHQGMEICDDGNTLSGDGCRNDCMKIEICGDGQLDQGEECDDANTNPNDGCYDCRLTEWLASVLSGFGETEGDPLSLNFNAHSVALDRNGNFFITDSVNHRIWRVDAATGLPTIVAGTGTEGSTGDGQPATSAQMSFPHGIAVDGLGNVFFADWYNHRVRQVCAGDASCPAGIIRTVAGTGARGFSGDQGLATSAQISSPSDVAVDGLGNVFFTDSSNHRVRQVCAGDASCPAGIIRTLAGTGERGFSGDEGPATSAQLSSPSGIVVDGRGNVFFADSSNHRIRRICAGDASCPAGVIRSVAGTGAPGFSGDDGMATSARVAYPSGVAVDERGNVFFADTHNHRIRRICAGDASCPAGTIRTVVGTGVAGFSGDDGPATSAQVAYPRSVVVDGLGNIFVSDSGSDRIRQVCAGDASCPAGTIRTVAGTGVQRFSGDYGPATSARLLYPRGVAVDALGNIFFSESVDDRIRQVCVGESSCLAGTIRTVAGTGVPGFSGDEGEATIAQIAYPLGVAVDGLGNVFFADSRNHRIRKVCAGDSSCPAGTIRTVAGTGVRGFSGDDMPATSAQIDSPVGVAVDGLGNVFFSDHKNHRVCQVCAGEASCPAGNIRTVAGTGVRGFSGDDVPATSAQIDSPVGVAVDGLGNVFFSDHENHRVRQVCAGDPCPPGNIRTVAGTGAPGFSGDDGLATAAQINSPTGIAVDGLGSVFFADQDNHRIRQVCAGDSTCLAGTIRTIAGTGVDGFSGDGGPSLNAQLNSPYGVAVDRFGNVFFSDSFNLRIRRICAGDEFCPARTIQTIAGDIDPSDGPLVRSSLEEPFSLISVSDVWLVADGVSGRIRRLDLAGDRLSTVVGYPGGFAADGAVARYSRLLSRPRGIAFDPVTERIFVSESEGHAIRVVDTRGGAWTVSTYAGIGRADLVEGTGSSAGFSAPSGLLFDAATDRLLVADRDNHVIRAVDTTNGETSTLVGTPRSKGFAGDNGPASDALLNAPEAIALDAFGSLYVADTGNNRVRRVDLSGTIDTVLGDGVAASSGEGAPARLFPVNQPLGVALDSYGNLFVSSSTTLRRVSAGDDGVATGDDEVSTIYGATPREVFPASVTNCLTGVAITENEADTPEARILVLDACAGFALALDRVAR